MVRITLSHGPSPSCPIGLVFFASYYGLAFSEPVKAYQLGKVLGVERKVDTSEENRDKISEKEEEIIIYLLFITASSRLA